MLLIFVSDRVWSCIKPKFDVIRKLSSIGKLENYASAPSVTEHIELISLLFQDVLPVPEARTPLSNRSPRSSKPPKNHPTTALSKIACRGHPTLCIFFRYVILLLEGLLLTGSRYSRRSSISTTSSWTSSTSWPCPSAVLSFQWHTLCLWEIVLFLACNFCCTLNSIILVFFLQHLLFWQFHRRAGYYYAVLHQSSLSFVRVYYYCRICDLWYL